MKMHCDAQFRLCVYIYICDTQFELRSTANTYAENIRDMYIASERLGGYNLFGKKANEHLEKKSTFYRCYLYYKTTINSRSLTLARSPSLSFPFHSFAALVIQFFFLSPCHSHRIFCVLCIAFARILPHFIHASFYFHSV